MEGIAIPVSIDSIFRHPLKNEEMELNHYKNKLKYYVEKAERADSLRMPKKYIINRGATIIFWNDGSKTIVRRTKNDEYNKRLGFLTAYFQKHSGLSKNKANKFLANLEEENIKE